MHTPIRKTRGRSRSARRAAAPLLAAAAWAGTAPAATLRVPGDYATIQAALDAAQPNDVVLVEPGTYKENLRLPSGVDLVGRETARTLLTPADDTLAIVTFPTVLGTRLSNFTLLGARVGVSVVASSGAEISNVVFYRMGDTGLVSDVSSAVEAANDVFFENATAIVRGSAATEAVNDIFAGNTVTLSNASTLVDAYAGVRADCFFGNEDLAVNGIDSGIGAGAVVGDPLFVDPAAHDFHLKYGSPCIDAGTGIDIIDATVADAGVYGGPYADVYPFPVGRPTLSATTGAGAGITVDWSPNLDYRVTNPVTPGGYRLYYRQGAAPDPNVPSVYTGTDAAGGRSPSPIDVGDVTSYTLSGLAPTTQRPLPPAPPRAAGRDGAVVLTWDAVSGATGYRVYYGSAAVDEHRVEAGAATSYTVTGLTNGTAYRFAVAALQQAAYAIAVTAVDNTPTGHESALSMPATSGVGDPAQSSLSATVSATPEAVVPYPDLPAKSTCLAHAAFGAEAAPELLVLRDFRDRILRSLPLGRLATAAYYAASPPAARFLERHAALKPAVRALLWPFVVLALVTLGGSPASWIAVAVLVAAEIALHRRVRRFARGPMPGAAEQAE